MKYEDEITVEVDAPLEVLKSILEKHNFKVMNEYYINDIYLLKNDIKINNDYLNILKNCVLIRHVIQKNKDKKTITYKYKEYNDKKEIVKQGSVDCHIDSVEEAIQLLNVLNYKEVIKVFDHLIIYSNGTDEFAVQIVNNKHIYIEIEEKGNYMNNEYKNIDEMKEAIIKYNIPIKNNDFFVRKAEIELMESLEKVES